MECDKTQFAAPMTWLSQLRSDEVKQPAGGEPAKQCKWGVVSDLHLRRDNQWRVIFEVNVYWDS